MFPGQGGFEVSGAGGKRRVRSASIGLLEGIAGGEKAVEDGRVVTHAQAKRRLSRWLKQSGPSRLYIEKRKCVPHTVRMMDIPATRAAIDTPTDANT